MSSPAQFQDKYQDNKSVYSIHISGSCGSGQQDCFRTRSMQTEGHMSATVVQDNKLISGQAAGLRSSGQQAIFRTKPMQPTGLRSATGIQDNRSCCFGKKEAALVAVYCFGTTDLKEVMCVLKLKLDWSDANTQKSQRVVASAQQVSFHDVYKTKIDKLYFQSTHG
jgi:hypothetical protein